MSNEREAREIAEASFAANKLGIIEGERRMLDRLREPSQGMLDAAFNNKDEHMEDIWEAMLATFLQENNIEHAALQETGQ